MCVLYICTFTSFALYSCQKLMWSETRSCLTIVLQQVTKSSWGCISNKQLNWSGQSSGVLRSWRTKKWNKLILELCLLFYVLGLEIVNCCYFALIYELCGGGNNRTIHCLKHSSLSDSENPAEKNNPVPLRYQRWLPIVTFYWTFSENIIDRQKTNILTAGECVATFPAKKYKEVIS